MPETSPLTPDTLQVVAHYDGRVDTQATVLLEFEDGTAATRTLSLPPLTPGNVVTWEIELRGWTPTGELEIAGAVGDGGIDGVAVGVLWSDTRLALWRTVWRPGSVDAALVGIWPLTFFSEAALAVIAPQLGTPEALRRAQMIAAGAELLPDGRYTLTENVLPGAANAGSEPGGLAGPVELSDDLTGNTSDDLAVDRLQLAVFSTVPGLELTRIGWSCDDPTISSRYLIPIVGLATATFDGNGTVLTREYDLAGCTPNGRIEVSGMPTSTTGVPGVAVGIFWRGADGTFHVARTAGSTRLGAQPAEIGDAQLDTQMPQVTTEQGRAQARTALRGAAFVEDGSHVLVTY